MRSPQDEIQRLQEELKGKQQEIGKLNTQLRYAKKETEKVRESMIRTRAENEKEIQEKSASQENTNRENIELLTAKNEELTNYIESLDFILDQLTAIDKTNQEHQEGIDFLSQNNLRDLVPENIVNDLLQKYPKQKPENQE